MVADTDLTTHEHTITHRHRAGHSNLTGEYNVPADHAVMGNMNRIIELGALPDHRVAKRAAVDRAIRADLNVILNYDTAELRHFG